MTLRIALVTPRFHPRVLGGAELLARWFAERLSRAGHRVEVLATCAVEMTWENALPPGTERCEGYLVRRYLADRPDHEARGDLEPRIRMRQRLSLEDEERWLRSGPASRAMEEDLARRAQEYDAVVGLPYLVGTTYFAFQAAPERFFLLPCLHDEPFAYLSTTARMLADSRGLIFNTEPERELARRIVPELAPSAVVGLGFEPEVTADPEAFRAKYEVSGPFGVYVGRLEHDKNVPLLIRYFSRYEERCGGSLELLLVGGGSRAEETEPLEPGARVSRLAWGVLAPNPSQQTLQGELMIPRAGLLQVRVYDVAGHAVAIVFRGSVAAGSRPMVWDGRDLHGQPTPPGVYLVSAELAGERTFRRIVRLR